MEVLPFRFQGRNKGLKGLNCQCVPAGVNGDEFLGIVTVKEKAVVLTRLCMSITGRNALAM